MDTRRALIFADANVGVDHYVSLLNEVKLQVLLPHELANNSAPVSIIIIERPAQNAIAIASNLKRQVDFKDVALLVLVDSADPDQRAQLTNLGADLFFKPVAPKALSRYLTTKVGPGQKEESSSEAEPQPEELPAQPKAPALPDVIPTSNRLLSVNPEQMKIAKGGVRCGECGRWRVRREDAFCSKCGEPLVVLKTDDEVVFEPYGEHSIGQLIELRNDGQNPLRMMFSIDSDRELARRFSLHTEASDLEAGYAEHLLAVFDARSLDLTTRYQAVLEITSNASGKSKERIPLVIDRLPIPRLTCSETYIYVLGGENEWNFRLVNEGGGTLVLSEIHLMDTDGDTSETKARLELLQPVTLKGTESSNVRVRIPPLDLSPAKYKKKVVFQFGHHKPVEADLLIEVIRPARLAVQPPELDFGVVSTHRSRKLSLQLVNGGGEDLVIRSLMSSADWLTCAAQTPVTILPGNAHIVDVQARGDIDRVGEYVGEIAIASNSYESEDQIIPTLVRFVEPAPYEPYIGVDFGTTASCVAVLDKDDQAFVIQLDSVPPGSQSDPRIMPSILFFQPDGSIITGREALKDADIQPANAITSIKRVLGAKQKKNLAGREFDPTELTSKIIEQLMLRTENALFELGEYKTPRRAIVTVPVEVFDNQRRALLEACKIAGLEMHSSSKHGVVIDEAHAAALYYLSKKEIKETAESGAERVLIFDFGGGTLDCALIEIDALKDRVRLTTLAPFGDPGLGGDDIDWALVGLLADRAKTDYPEFDVNCLGNEQTFKHHYRTSALEEAAYNTRSRFKRQAEIAKITLSQLPAVELSIAPLIRVGATPLESYVTNGTGPAKFDSTLTQDDLASVIEPFLTRAASVVETICRRAKVQYEDIDTILHVGRTSLLPIVRERINAILPNAEDRSNIIEPKLCVALGAAFWGQIKDQPHSNFEFVGGANQLLHDIGFIDFSTGALRQMFVTVFPAQTEFPCEKTIELPLTKDRITLQLAENRGTKSVIDGNTEIRRIGRVVIDAQGADGQTIEVIFRIDENRVLEITANGQTQNIELVDE
jgi:molecular chaperone DnaK